MGACSLTILGSMFNHVRGSTARTKFVLDPPAYPHPKMCLLDTCLKSYLRNGQDTINSRKGHVKYMFD